MLSRDFPGIFRLSQSLPSPNPSLRHLRGGHEMTQQVQGELLGESHHRLGDNGMIMELSHSWIYIYIYTDIIIVNNGYIDPLVISHMSGWKIPEVNGSFIRNITDKWIEFNMVTLW